MNSSTRGQEGKDKNLLSWRHIARRTPKGEKLTKFDSRAYHWGKQLFPARDKVGGDKAPNRINNRQLTKGGKGGCTFKRDKDVATRWVSRYRGEGAQFKLDNH